MYGFSFTVTSFKVRINNFEEARVPCLVQRSTCYSHLVLSNGCRDAFLHSIKEFNCTSLKFALFKVSEVKTALHMYLT